MNQITEKLTSLTLTVMVLLSVMTVAFTGGAAAANASDYEFDEQLQDGKTYWEGQVLWSDEGASNAGDIYEVHSADSEDFNYFQQVEADENGTLTIKTSGLEAGEYYLENESNTEVARFNIVQQNFAASTSDADSSDYTYTFEFNSNRVGSDVKVSAAGLNATELKDIFNPSSEAIKTDADGNDYYVIQSVNDGTEVDATFSDDTAGTYDFQFSVTDTDANDAVNGFEVSKQSDATASFSETLSIEQEGDIATFNVSMDGTTNANLHIGDADINYEYNLTLTDGNDDGVVTVQFNSANAGNGASDTVTAKNPKDSVSPLHAEPTLSNQPLDTGTYKLRLVINNEIKDVASLMLKDRSTTGASTHLVPKADDTNTVDDITANAVSGSTVALGDKLIVQFEATGVYAALDGKTASDLATGTSGLSVEVEELDPEMNADAKELDVSKADLRVDAENDKFYLVFDTQDYTLADGESYEVRFNMTEANPYITSAEEADAQDTAAEFTVADREATFQDYNKADSYLPVKAEDSYTVTADTTMAPGTETTVIALAEGESPFLYQKKTNVSANGTISADFDFSALQEGTEFSIEVQNFESVTAKAVSDQPDRFNLNTVVVDEDGNAVDATIEVDGTAYDGDIALTNGTYSVTTSADGYSDATEQVTIDGADADLTLTLGPETHELNIVTVDEDGNPVDASVTVDSQPLKGDSLALENGDYTVKATAEGYTPTTQEITVDGAATSVTLTLSAEQTTTTTSDNPTTTTTTKTAPTTTEEETPGFGVALGIVAMLGAALLALRREN